MGMNVAMFASVGLGYVGGIVATFVMARFIVAAALRGAAFDAAQRRTVVKLAAAGGLVALLPALLVGTVVGGTLGGAYGEIIARGTVAEASGVVLGIAVGMFAAVALIMCTAVLAGAYVGRFIANRSDA